MYPECELYFTGTNCTGDAFYSAEAGAAAPALVEKGIVVRGRVYARDRSAAGDPEAVVTLEPKSTFQTVDPRGVEPEGCRRFPAGGGSVQGVPAVSRRFKFRPPLRVEIR